MKKLTIVRSVEVFVCRDFPAFSGDFHLDRRRFPHHTWCPQLSLWWVLGDWCCPGWKSIVNCNCHKWLLMGCDSACSPSMYTTLTISWLMACRELREMALKMRRRRRYRFTETAKLCVVKKIKHSLPRRLASRRHHSSRSYSHWVHVDFNISKLIPYGLLSLKIMVIGSELFIIIWCWSFWVRKHSAVTNYLAPEEEEREVLFFLSALTLRDNRRSW